MSGVDDPQDAAAVNDDEDDDDVPLLTDHFPSINS